MSSARTYTMPYFRLLLAVLAIIQLATCSPAQTPSAAQRPGDPVNMSDSPNPIQIGAHKEDAVSTAIRTTTITKMTTLQTVTAPRDGMPTVYRAQGEPVHSTVPSPSSTPTNSGPPLRLQKVADPVVIHPSGVYIRASSLNNNTNHIIAGFAAPSPGNASSKSLLASASTNGGKSWSHLGEIWRIPDPASHDVDNAFPLQLPSGRILYSFRNHDLRGGSYVWYRITVCASDDGGKTWFFLSQVEERQANTQRDKNNGLWEPFLRVGRKRGEVQVFYSAGNGSDSQDNVMRWSDDGGRTWSRETVVVSNGPGGGKRSRDGMMGVAEVDGKGKLICIFESTESGVFAITRVLSDDDGRTWHSRARVYTAGGGKNAGAPQVNSVGGSLVASFMINEGSGTKEIDGGQMKVVMSNDGGRTWSSDGVKSQQQAAVAGDRGSHWPGLYTLDGQHFLALYSRDGVGAVSQRYRVVRGG